MSDRQLLFISVASVVFFITMVGLFFWKLFGFQSNLTTARRIELENFPTPTRRSGIIERPVLNSENDGTDFDSQNYCPDTATESGRKFRLTPHRTTNVLQKYNSVGSLVTYKASNNFL